MLYELRSYFIEPTLIDEYLAWANDKALPILQGDHGFRVLGFWRVDEIDSRGEDEEPTVVWLVAWQDREERERQWSAARASARWAEAREGRPNYHRRPAVITYLSGIPRSPLQ